MDPIVTVVVPIWRLEPDLFAKCIQSLNKQKLSTNAFEVVVCFDGTPHVEVATAEQLLNGLVCRWSAVRTSHNLGMAIARNSCAAAARGSWITLLDHDDQLEPIALIMLLAASQVDCDLVYSNFSRLRADTGNVTFSSRLATYDKLLARYRVSLDCPLLHSTHILQALLIRRSRFWELDGFDPSAGLAHEVDFRIRLYNGSNFAFVDECLYRYVQRGNSTYHTRHRELVDDTCRVLQNHFTLRTESSWSCTRIGKLNVSDVTLYGFTDSNGRQYRAPWISYIDRENLLVRHE